MRFQLLGQVAAWDNRGPIELGPAKQRTVLAVLLLDPGVAISIDQLVDRVWGLAPPQRARRTLHTYLSRLRGVFSNTSEVTLTRRSAGYACGVDESAVDLHRFRALVRQARQVTDCDTEVALWENARALWRGTPFADLTSDYLQKVAVGLHAELRAATLDHTDALLRRGEHQRLLPDLTTAVTENPMDERLAGQLMLALYRCGRQGDALACYRQVYDQLVEEFGSDPGPALQSLHQRILRQDPELAWEAGIEKSVQREHMAPVGQDSPPVGADTQEAGPAPRPAQLPADVAGFTGRDIDLRRLDAMLDAPADDRSARPVVITAIGGTAGVGKTALAVHWGHQVADRFPDGQLYLNLRGYDPDQPVSPTDALARLLTALGVPGSEIPVEMDDRAARYRSELAERRMLIVLDNAASAAQVRPLLPGSGPCQVVVTSRDSLAGLVAVQGAQRIDLDLLPAPEAVGLLATLIGPPVTAEPAAAAALAEQCARLPLALRVAAELVVSRPGESLAGLVAELADLRQRLELLEAGGDPHAAVRQVFSWSVQHLPEPAATVFRLLGLHPGSDLDGYAAAALAGIGLGPARRSLEALARAHLVHRTGPGRYGMHDLLRAYAAQLATVEDSAGDRQAAQDRLLDYYRAAAEAAMDVLHPADAYHRPRVPACVTEVPELTNFEAAHTWLATELLNLTAMVAHAAAHGPAEYGVGMARILHRYLDSACPTDGLTINGHARRAAAQAGDLNGEAHALRQLGIFYNRLGRYERAIQHLQQALDGFRTISDQAGEALTLTGLGMVNYRMGNHTLSLEQNLRAVTLAERIGDRLTEGYALVNLGVVEERIGRYPAAAEHQRQAAAVLLELGSRYGAGIALSNLANVELRQGDYPAAAAHLRESLEVLRELGTTIAEANAWDTLGQLHLRQGEPEPAEGCFLTALDVYRRIGDRIGQAWSLNGLGEVAVFAKEYAQALTYHEEALVIAGDTGTRHQHARAHAGLGHAHRGLGENATARENLELAYAEYTDLDMLEADEVREALAALDD